ncbi:MAG: hypothetical protein GWN53_17455 [Gammaproteobacteria bacterium]|uniref:Zinc-ribbon domain-containing protein n=1 Tax=Candidatus Kutchimonas denitrificans TaxID=3056748 RepID=A0AAE5CAS0_9BACT|nr:hypothetical protein [Candidatus Kutchimonas denitrificans]NIV53629.1 hypothetical protein [Gammaproteobacteria bacterium]
MTLRHVDTWTYGERGTCWFRMDECGHWQTFPQEKALKIQTRPDTQYRCKKCEREER